MNKHSIIRLITLFFILIFALINGLFWIAYQHFSKQHEVEQIRRFLLADRLFHHNQHDFSAELSQLMIHPSSLSSNILLSKGTTVISLPFGKMIEYEGHTFFVNFRPPPPPSFQRFGFKLPPPQEMRHFRSVVLEDIQPHSLMMFWIILIAIDSLILLFFGYLLRKLLPLHRLKNSIIAFKEGDPHLDLPISGQDEISQITHEFNLTLEKISAMREARSLFLRNILHELKTPIMKGSLTTDCLTPSSDQERLKHIFERMDYLLGEFAKMEQFSSGEWKLNLQEYRFVDLIDHACDVLLCNKESICIKGEKSQLIVKVDFELFTIVLKNLLDNALKYSVGKPILNISTNEITICSIGEPLPVENQTFSKPFNRPYENSSVGLGLGLYITDSIIKKHGFRLHYRYKEEYNCFGIILY
ncbi:ArsS family sensor histidine kinase [Sulfuricurvum sp.]|uniref:ArsS family sensor histidine kinase n=1 Tax=Sulfuricurvum sp. TaxID=2025608 RepID=UPI00356642F2